ncbi:unnamed protein product [Urochloa humidicola]
MAPSCCPIAQYAEPPTRPVKLICLTWFGTAVSPSNAATLSASRHALRRPTKREVYTRVCDMFRGSVANTGAPKAHSLGYPPDLEFQAQHFCPAPLATDRRKLAAIEEVAAMASQVKPTEMVHWEGDIDISDSSEEEEVPATRTRSTARKVSESRAGASAGSSRRRAVPKVGATARAESEALKRRREAASVGSEADVEDSGAEEVQEEQDVPASHPTPKILMEPAEFEVTGRAIPVVPLRAMPMAPSPTPPAAPLGLNVRRKKSMRPAKLARTTAGPGGAPTDPAAAAGSGPANAEPGLGAEGATTEEARPSSGEGKITDAQGGAVMENIEVPVDMPVLEDINAPADTSGPEEVGGRGKQVEQERVLPTWLFQVGSSVAEEERALERAMKEDRDDVIAVAVACERLKAYLDRADEQSGMIREALNGRREITRLKARVYEVVNEAKDVMALKEREIEKTAELNRELTECLSKLTQETAQKERELQEAHQRDLAAKQQELDASRRREAELQAALASKSIRVS